MAGGNILLKGYTAAIANVLTTELNTLTDGNVTALGPEQTNTALDMVADFQLDLASLTITAATAFCYLYIVPSIDGTNYPDFSSGATANYHAAYMVATFLLKNVTTTTARANVSAVPLPPGKFKVALRNGTGASLAGSGNTVGIRAYAASYT